MRLLRVGRPDSIRNPEAYLFTIANHVLYQHALRKMTAHETLNFEDSDDPPDGDADPASLAELHQRLQNVDKALGQLSDKARAALILYRRDGFSLEEVAAHLGVSLAMVKKYLAKAILHCRQQMPPDE